MPFCCVAPFNSLSFHAHHLNSPGASSPLTHILLSCTYPQFLLLSLPTCSSLSHSHLQNQGSFPPAALDCPPANANTDLLSLLYVRDGINGLLCIFHHCMAV